MADDAASSGMYRDIISQPDCWERVLHHSPKGNTYPGEWWEAVRATRHGLLVGMGSSHYAGQAMQMALMQSGAVWQPVTSDVAVHYLPAGHRFETAVVISQSGESADTVAA